MKRTLEKRILLFAIMVLLVAIAINTGLNVEGFRRDYRDGIILRCQSLAQGLQQSLEKVLSLGVRIEDIEGIDVKCKTLVVNDPDIVYCYIENNVGELFYANDQSFDSLKKFHYLFALTETTAVLQHPEWGKVYDVSQPVFDANKSVAGRIRIGFPDEVLVQRTVKALIRAFYILAIALIVVVCVVVLFVKRDIISPISRLCVVAREIADGNFRIKVPEMTTRDFSELAHVIQEMSESLQSRDDKISESYSQLETTNQELLVSYEHQARISNELSRSRAMYRSLLEDASDSIVVVDDTDRIVLVNKAAERFFRVQRHAAEGMNFYSFLQMLGVKDIEEQHRLFQQVLAGDPIESELRYTRDADGAQVVGWLYGSTVFGGEGERMVQAIIRDVTLEREIKENLEKSAAELRRLNEMKDSFLGVASHELKTPLTVINGYVELILDEMADHLDDEIKPLIRHIADAGDRLAAIVRDMVDVTLIDDSNLTLRKVRTDINALARNVGDSLALFLGKRSQQLQLILADDLPMVTCDPDRIVQALNNLVINAIKFTPDDGWITIATKVRSSLREPFAGSADTDVITLGSEPARYVEIVVTDSGIGISEQDQLHIFEKFYEAGKIEEHFTGQITFKGKGTGLGLTIVKGIVDMHDGEVWVESPGCNTETFPGSAFHILLPLDSPQSMAVNSG